MFLATRRDVGIGENTLVREVIIILVARLVSRSAIAARLRSPQRKNTLITLAQTAVERRNPAPGWPRVEVRKSVTVPEPYQIAGGSTETTHMPLIIGNIIDADVLQLSLHLNRRQSSHKT